jgi:tRNA-Thr(GGU) m(6)t(6)A37 methyltransferase TsaA
MKNMNDYLLEPIGWVRSELKKTKDAPRFYTEGAPNARLELDARLWDAMEGIEVGDEIVVITWLHLANRETLKVHPRGDLTRPKRGVFSTRSPHRPNPLGLHRAKVLAIDQNVVSIGPIEAIDGTPVVDIKCVVNLSLTTSWDALSLRSSSRLVIFPSGRVSCKQYRIELCQ